MARISLNDLHFFLNRRFWRYSLLFEKTIWLRIAYAAECCLLGLRPGQAEERYIASDRGCKKSNNLWVVLVHTLTRYATELPVLCWRVSGVVSSNQQGARHEFIRELQS